MRCRNGLQFIFCTDDRNMVLIINGQERGKIPFFFDESALHSKDKVMEIIERFIFEIPDALNTYCRSSGRDSHGFCNVFW